MVTEFLLEHYGSAINQSGLDVEQWLGKHYMIVFNDLLEMNRGFRSLSKSQYETSEVLLARIKKALMALYMSESDDRYVKLAKEILNEGENERCSKAL